MISSNIKKVAFFTFALVIIPFAFFAFIELGLRFFIYNLPKNNKNIFQFSWCCGYGLKFNPESPYLIDESGFRRTVLDLSDKPENEIYRILAIGDSITFGSTNDEYLNYPAYLEFVLNSPGFIPNKPRGKKYFKVINAGIMGYTSLWAKKYLREIVPRIKPDMVIVSIGANDLNRVASNPLLLFAENYIPGFYWFYNSSATAANLRRLLKTFVNVGSGIGERVKKKSSMGDIDNIYGFNNYKKNITEMIDFLKGKEILTILVPWSFGDGLTVNQVEEIFYHERKIKNEYLSFLYRSFAGAMIRIGKKNGSRIIKTPFQAPIIPKKHNTRYFMTSSVHLNNSGSRILAYTIARAINGVFEGKGDEDIDKNSWGDEVHGDLLDFYVEMKDKFELVNLSDIRLIISMKEKKIADYCLQNQEISLRIKNLHFSECFFAVPDTALSFIREGKPDKAQPYLDYAVKKYPFWPYSFYVYGIFEFHFGTKELSMAYFKKAIKLAPYFKNPRYLLRDYFKNN